MKRFSTKITKARFRWSPFTAMQMLDIADDTRKHIQNRIQSAVNCEDQPAQPLKENRFKYPEKKVKAGIEPLRNWISPVRYPRSHVKLTRAMRVLRTNENRAEIGFIDPNSDRIAHINNQREKQFGVSPADRTNLVQKVKESVVTSGLVKTEKVA